MSLPVLTFHSIHDMPSPVAIPEDVFRGMMHRLASSGWKTVTAADAIAYVRGGLKLAPRSFLITFDDGYASVQTHAAPVLRELGFKAVLFVATGLVDRPRIFPGDPLCPPERGLTWAEIESLASSGIEIGSHAISHRDLTSLDDSELEDELAASRRVLEERLGIAVPVHAYPFGGCDRRVARACARHYEAAFTTRLAWAGRREDPWRLPRLDAHYLRFLATRGDLGSALTHAWMAVRRVGRGARAILAPERRA